MSSSSMQCSVTGLGIASGTKVRCVLLTQSPYDGEDPRKAWIVRTPPIRATYNDHGSIKDIHPDDQRIADLWLRGLREDAVEKGPGDNTYHDVAVARDMTFSQMLDAIQENRLEVIRDALGYWTRPKRGVGDCPDAPWAPPLMRRVSDLLEAMEPGCVSREPQGDKYVIDEPVPHMARVRFGQYAHCDRPHHLRRAKDTIERLGLDLTCAITAGTGRYAATADLLVFPRPAEDGHPTGPTWDMRSGASVDDDRVLRVGLAMIREDVWQAMIRFPHREYMRNQHLRDLKYPHKREKIADPDETDGVYAWHGIDAYRFSIRLAWSRIDRALRGEPLPASAGYAPPEANVSPDEEDEKIDDLLDKALDAHEKKLAAMSEEERATHDAAEAESAARWDAEQQRKKEHPFFGDFCIMDMHHRLVENLPGAWQLVDSTPGVLGIGEHLSMLVADRIEPWDGLLDALAELGAVRDVLGDVGIVMRPAESTGPQYPEWGHSMRFARMVLDVATVAGAQAECARPFPASLDEVGICERRARKKQSARKKTAPNPRKKTPGGKARKKPTRGAGKPTRQR